MSSKLYRLVAFGALMTAALAAQAQTYRVTNSLYGNYTVQTTATITGLPIPGSNVFSRWDSLGYANQYQQEFNASNLPLTTQASNAWSDSFGYGLPTVDQTLYAKTDFRNNHALASNDNYTALSTNSTVTTCPQVAGVCVGSDITINTQQQSYLYGVAQSTWEELYYIGNGVGTGVQTPTYHVSGILGPSASAGDGDSSIYWRQSDFLGRTVLGLSAYYSRGSWGDYWSVNLFDPVTQSWVFDSAGTGTLNLSMDITANIQFTYGAPFYVNSSLTASATGNGVADVKNTVTLTGLKLPEGARFFVGSGTDYRDAVSFDGVGGTLCPDQGCAFGGGGGGIAISNVPEPEARTLLLAGLGVAGLVAWRRRQPRA